MAHMHEQVVLVKITTLKKGNHVECGDAADVTPEVLANIEALVGELLQEPGRVIEVFVDDEQVK